MASTSTLLTIDQFHDQYASSGHRRPFVFDPEARVVWEWSRQTANLERIETLVLGNGSSVEVSAIWLEFEGRLSQFSDLR